MKKILLLIILLLPIFVHAEDITSSSVILVNNTKKSNIIDNKENTYIKISKGIKITISNDIDIDGIYIIYELKSVNGIINANGKELKIGQNGFLHEYIDIYNNLGNIKELSITYDDNAKIAEIYVFSKGDLPEYVEVWDTPLKEADLLLFSTHSDDEQLFFAGLMPTYIDKGAKIQVVYFTNHNDNPKRLHEQIHGLYTVGIRNYPIIGFVPDKWSTTLEQAITNLNEDGYTEEDTLKFEVENIRRFKPLVVVGHDEAGEYSHGQHILNTHVLESAILKTNDKSYDIDSYNKYGGWEVSKVYLHLYNENKIALDYDIPLESFNGKTAYEVSKEGFSKHYSQQFTWFTKWLTGVNDKGEGTPYNSVKEITKYSPCEYGLYYTTVGEDENKNDMFENLTLRKDIKPNIEEKVKDVIKEVKEKNNNYYLYIGIPLLLIVLLVLKRKLRRKRKKNHR